MIDSTTFPGKKRTALHRNTGQSLGSRVEFSALSHPRSDRSTHSSATKNASGIEAMRIVL